MGTAQSWVWVNIDSYTGERGMDKGCIGVFTMNNVFAVHVCIFAAVLGSDVKDWVVEVADTCA